MGWRPGAKPAPSLTCRMKKRRPVLAERIGGASQRPCKDVHGRERAAVSSALWEGPRGRRECAPGQRPQGRSKQGPLPACGDHSSFRNNSHGCSVGRRGWELGTLARSGCSGSAPHRCQVRLGAVGRYGKGQGAGLREHLLYRPPPCGFAQVWPGLLGGSTVFQDREPCAALARGRHHHHILVKGGPGPARAVRGAGQGEDGCGLGLSDGSCSLTQ